MSDLLNIDKINSLPHPIRCRFAGDDVYSTVETICVQTGLMRIDVMGLIDLRSFGEVMELIDIDNQKYNVDEFYSDYEETTP